VYYFSKINPCLWTS